MTQQIIQVKDYCGTVPVSFHCAPDTSKSTSEKQKAVEMAKTIQD